MKTITLTKGYEAIVDDADYSDVAQFKWNALTLKTFGHIRQREGCGDGL